MVECYLDESGTDEQSPTAVVGGFLLRRREHFWLRDAWANALSKHGVEPPIHMREFGPHGRFKSLRHHQRRALFADLQHIINDNKRFSIAATLTTERYRQYFSGAFTEKEMGVYGMCFLVLAVMLGKHADATGYTEIIPFLMDTGNPYKQHVVDAHNFLTTTFQHTYPIHPGSLTFVSDTDDPAIEAADVIAWTARRKLVGQFNNGFEPLEEILAEQHMEQPLEDGWMDEIASAIRHRKATGEWPRDGE